MTRDLDTPLEIALGVVESTRAWYMDVIHDRDEVDGPLDCQRL